MRPYRPNNSTGARNVPTTDQQMREQARRRRFFPAILENTRSGLDVASNGHTLHTMPSSISEGFGSTAEQQTRELSERRSHIPATSPLLLRNTRSSLDVASNGRSIHMMPSSLFEVFGSSDNPSPTYGSSGASATGEVGNTQCPLGCRCKRRANGELYGQTSSRLPEMAGYSERYVRMRTNSPLLMGNAIQQSTAYPLVHPNLGASPWNFSIPSLHNASPLNGDSNYRNINFLNGIFGERTSYIPGMQHNAPHLNGDSSNTSSTINLPHGIFGEGTSNIPGMPRNALHLNGDSNSTSINLPNGIFGEETSYILATMLSTTLPLQMVSSTSIQQRSPDFVELGSTSTPRNAASLTPQISSATSTYGDLDSSITAASIENATLRSFLEDMAAVNLHDHIRNMYMYQIHTEMARIRNSGAIILEGLGLRNTRLNSDGASSSRVNETRRSREDAILNLLRERRYISPPRDRGNASSEVELCCICQDEYVQGEDRVKLKCEHDFHTGCLTSWLLERNACPLCNAVAIEF